MKKIMTYIGGYIGNEIIAPITEEVEVLLPIGVLQKSEDDLQLYGEVPILMPGPYNVTTVNPENNGI